MNTHTHRLVYTHIPNLFVKLHFWTQGCAFGINVYSTLEEDVGLMCPDVSFNAFAYRHQNQSRRYLFVT